MKTTISMGHEKDGLYLTNSTSQSSIASSAIQKDVSPTTTDAKYMISPFQRTIGVLESSTMEGRGTLPVSGIESKEDS